MSEHHPLERIPRPSVLLLDCPSEVAEAVRDRGFTCHNGSTGFSDGRRAIPKDSSEVDIVFWDLSGCDFGTYHDNDFASLELRRTQISAFTPTHVRRIESVSGDRLALAGKTLRGYLQEVIVGGGYLVGFLGASNTGQSVASLVSNGSLNFELKPRYTDAVLRADEPRHFHDYVRRFVSDETILLGVDVAGIGPLDGTPILFDKDMNVFAFDYEGRFFLGPKPGRLKDACLYLLTDVLPSVVPDVFPGEATFPWLSAYVGAEEADLSRQMSDLRAEYEARQQVLLDQLQTAQDEEDRIRRLLYADDSEFFESGGTLSDAVAYTLSEVFEYESVQLMDPVYESRGEPRHEDIRVGSKMLVEVKGTERGAKRNWRDDLSKHTLAMCRSENLLVTEVKPVLVFNHERRLEPKKRSVPFADSVDMIEQCCESGVLFISAVDLYALAQRVRSGEIESCDARRIIDESVGLLSIE